MSPASSYAELPDGADPRFGIEAVWLSLAGHARTYRVLPDGRCDIILRFCASPGPIKNISVVVTGPTTAHYDVPIQPGIGFTGIRLRPGFFQTVLGFKPVALREKTLVDDAAISACPLLATLCIEADRPEALPDRLIDFVRSRIGQDHAPLPGQTRRILSAFHASSGRLPVQDIAQLHGLSARTVQRIVLDATGLPPKSYARILQFHRAMRLLRDHRLRPSEAALEAGYADQAHMTHALRRFGGLSPARLADVTLVTLRE
ncbi:helix-turn-helix domain-containing protein [Roseinatronobacter monicus]|uniref:AraC family transcriptional regulator n=1 Tax=Roseinatronobacter monicus TaxID=393481 RepID=A0A543K3Z4_9RHOB|nr:AraC family transcriptional regulator [Roseinatronobacter monicus]TQM89775.1 AraC family transcriptional regulator [Roseinatronobacter monicus]